MTGEPGTTARLRCIYWEGPLPPPGDFLRTAAGSCYRIDEVRAGRAGSATVATFICTRLERDAVQGGQDGVWGWRWSPRRPAGA